MGRNDTKCKYMFIIPLKNLARKGLILLGLNKRLHFADIFNCILLNKDVLKTKHYLNPWVPRIIPQCNLNGRHIWFSAWNEINKIPFITVISSAQIPGLLYYMFNWYLRMKVIFFFFFFFWWCSLPCHFALLIGFLPTFLIVLLPTSIQELSRWQFCTPGQLWCKHIDSLLQYCSISRALAMEILQSCTGLLIYVPTQGKIDTNTNRHLVVRSGIYPENTFWAWFQFALESLLAYI